MMKIRKYLMNRLISKLIEYAGFTHLFSVLSVSSVAIRIRRSALAVAILISTQANAAEPRADERLEP